MPDFTTTEFGKFWADLWWVPNGNGEIRRATPGECAAEIKRLRDQAGTKIVNGSVEAWRAVTLVRAVYDIDGFEMTTQEAIDVLGKVDAAAERGNQ